LGTKGQHFASSPPKTSIESVTSLYRILLLSLQKFYLVMYLDKGASSILLNVGTYRVSQEERARIRESVPYVKV
jgi:hypothetical protein